MTHNGRRSEERKEDLDRNLRKLSKQHRVQKKSELHAQDGEWVSDPASRRECRGESLATAEAPEDEEEEAAFQRTERCAEKRKHEPNMGATAEQEGRPVSGEQERENN
ncbi:UNVERIFIED_CONTAM: hypothetical protein HHA_450230 [Hammondia hammondi]|eukprot:XP_008889221.1 hypothetical protein HHA_450230 [Hammondia hammondi]